jgi:hypothetical protein
VLTSSLDTENDRLSIVFSVEFRIYFSFIFRKETIIMSSFDDLKNNPMVLYPPMSGDVKDHSRDHIIYLAGSTVGISTMRTWHYSILEMLDYFNFDGKVYIPFRLDAGESVMYSREENYQKNENDHHMKGRSFAVVYWSDDTHRPSDLQFLLELVWESGSTVHSRRKRPVIFFGAKEESPALHHFEYLSHHIRIYSNQRQLVSDVIDAVKPFVT